MILGYSRRRYVEFTTDISTDTIPYYNMNQIVIERKLKASKSRFNPKFMDFAEYYGIVVRLCYPYRPDTKGKIENTIKYLRYNFFNGRTLRGS